MLSLSKRCQYALRAAYELAGKLAGTSTSTAEIAAAQAIPARFLEQIMKEFKQAGIVGSHRGPRGGYVLLASVSRLTVGDIVRLVDGPIRPVKCIAIGGDEGCPLRDDCAFEGLWKATSEAVARVLDNTTLQDLLHTKPGSRKVELRPS